ncbi:MAG: hypothetical protein HN509_07220 [Halobacteriovoraceae bacterium]|jgi:hypothetical protein|nr:hypothetical protein [Halobacteriovoraceae bacterium]
MKRICWSSDGKGRLHVGRNSYLFSYESLLAKEKKRWSLGLDIPVHGEEILTLDYPQIAAGKYRVKGELYRRLKRELSGGSAKGRSLSNFIRHLSLMIEASSNGQLPVGFKVESSSEKQFRLSARTSSNQWIRLQFSDIGPYGYRKQLFVLREKDFRGQIAEPLKLYFFLSECSSSSTASMK